MKHVHYVLGLLRITAPKKVTTHRDSMGNAIIVKTITDAMTLRTVLPKGVTSWDGSISNASFNSWKKGMGVSRTYSRIQVAPLGTGIVNKKKLVLSDEIRY